MKHGKFTREELKHRAFLRLSNFLYSLWEEGDEADTRLFDKVIPEEYVLGGRSVRAPDKGAHKEHVVPCAVLRNRVFEQFDNGKTCEEVAVEIRKYLVVVYLHPDEAKHMDYGLGLKSKMPKEDWSFESGDILARLNEAGIKLA